MKIYYYTTATIKTQKYLLNSIFSALAMATSLHPSNAFYHRFTPTSYKHRILNFYRRFPSSFSGRFRVLTYRGSGHGVCSSSSISKASNANNTEAEKVAVQQEKENYNERPPFDINLAVVLAGFAYEAYTSSPKNVGKWEADAAGCKTVCLSKLREIYDGQLFIKLKKGFDFPALDPWVLKSKVKWGKKEPTWDKDFTINVKLPLTKNLQVAAWDANLVTPHKRMGNTGIGLKCLCDGNLYEVLINLEGMGGGGKLQLEFNARWTGDSASYGGFLLHHAA
ncbi:hypothetical protein Peur_005140 [Populus x canadensis]